MAAEVLVGLFTLGGVALGAGLAYMADRRLWRRSQAPARLLLAETYSHLWTEEGWTNAMIHLERLRAHLEMLSVPTQRVDDLTKAVRMCRGEIAKQLEEGSYDPDFGPGLNMKLLGEYRAAVDAIVADLR